MDGPDDSDERRVLELLRELGATEQEIDATPTDQRSALAIELAMRDGLQPLTPHEAATALGRSPEELAPFWRALGFSTDASARPLPGSLVEAQGVLASAATALLGEEAAVGLARVIGATTSRLAEAVVNSFRVGYELPELDRGVSYSDVVTSFVQITRASLPAFEQIVLAAFRAHLVRVAASGWVPDAGVSAERRRLAVGFADLVGYTALSRTLSPAELARLLRRFEDGVNDVLARHTGRLVKQIGDGMMFAADDADEGCAIALDLAAAFPRADGVPPVRVGLAFGTVLTQYGDYYGDVVNLAARLVAVANPGTVVVNDEIAAITTRWQLHRLPDQALKGFGTPEVVHRLLGRAPSPSTKQ